MFKWLRLSLTDDERQNLTTFSLMGGIVALTGVIALLVYVLLNFWPKAIVNEQAVLLMGYLYHIILGLLALQGIQILTQAAIALGGFLKASFGGASIEAGPESKGAE